MRVLDLFAGPGGWSEGMASVGVRSIGLEIDADACRTRVAAGHLTVRTDVTVYPPEPFGGFDGLVASPPCQAFSAAGKREGEKDVPALHSAIAKSRQGWSDDVLRQEWHDARSPLIFEPLRWAWTVRPTWIACEQVSPCLPLWEHMADVLRAWGYQATAVKLCAADYGVPQTRTRAFLLAHRDELRVAEPTHAEYPEPGLFGDRQPWVTMAEALGWGMTTGPSGTLTAGNGRQGGPDPLDGGSGARARYRRAREEGDWRIALRSGPQANATVRSVQEPAGTVFAGHQAADIQWVRTSFGEPHRGKDAGSPKPEFNPTEQPCRTVNTKTGDWVRTRPSTSVQSTDRIGRPGTKDWEGGESQFDNDAVRITLEEAAVLQGFRPDYPFQGTKTSTFRQVGNAVPPTWAARIIGALSGATP